jgi:hypothetical protein
MFGSGMEKCSEQQHCAEGRGTKILNTGTGNQFLELRIRIRDPMLFIPWILDLELIFVGSQI